MSTISFDQYGTTASGSDGAFPTSGSSTSADDTLFGVTKALAVVPVGVAPTTATPQDIMELPPGATGLGQIPQGADIRPLESVLALFDHMSSAERATLQQRLYDAGYYSSSYYGTNPPIIVPGEADSASRFAWKSAVEDASRQSVYDPATHQLTQTKTVQEVIADRIANRQAQGVATGAAGAKKPAQITQLTNPDDIRRAVVDEARATLGHRVDEATINDIISRYQQKQSEAQQATGSVVTQAPSLSTFASQQVAASNPTDTAAHRGLGIGNLIMSAFMSGAGNAPTGGSGG